MPFSASEFLGDVKNRDSKTVSLTVANVDVIVARLRLSELLWLKEKEGEDERGTKSVKDSFALFFSHSSNRFEF